jgi:hypothetical protein
MRIRLLACLLLCTARPALADWAPVFYSGSFTGTIALNGYTASVTEPMTSNGNSAGPMSTLAHQIYALPYQAKSSLDTQMRAMVAGSPISFTGSSISGPIRIGLAGLSGANAGLNQASFSGLTYRASLYTSGSWFIFSYDCYATLAVNDVTAVVSYAPYTGTVSTDPALTYVHLNPTASASCSNSLDFIPIIGDYINSYIQGTITSAALNQLNGFGSTALSQVIPMGPSFLGIYNVIPPGRYVMNIGGVPFDAGAYLHDNFASWFAGRSLSVVLGPQVVLQSTTAVNEPLIDTTVANVVTIDFSDPGMQLVLAVQDTRYFVWRHYCVPGRPCYAIP